MTRAGAIAAIALLACCSGVDEGDVQVDILGVAPAEVQREGGYSTVRFHVRGAGPAYYSLSVGLDRRLVASGRVEGDSVREVVVSAGDLDPCTNQVSLAVVAPGGASDRDTDVVFLCPTPGCRGCSEPPPDGDADVDVDADGDGDADADPCAPGSFPNGGACDPVSNRCCEPRQTCEPNPFVAFVETCSSSTGSQPLGAWCGSGACAPGLTCFQYTCTRYCGEQGWDYDCPDGYRCYSFRVSVNDGPFLTCPSYGICLPY